MLRKSLLSFCCCCSCRLRASPKFQGLPDFTELVEKQGPAVVNVSTTSAARAAARSRRLPEV